MLCTCDTEATVPLTPHSMIFLHPAQCCQESFSGQSVLFWSVPHKIQSLCLLHSQYIEIFDLIEDRHQYSINVYRGRDNSHSYTYSSLTYVNGIKCPFLGLYRCNWKDIHHFCNFKDVFQSSKLTSSRAEFDLVHSFLERRSYLLERRVQNFTILVVFTSTSDSSPFPFFCFFLRWHDIHTTVFIFIKFLQFTISFLDTWVNFVLNKSFTSALFSATTEAKLRSPSPEAILTNGVTQFKTRSR